MVNNSKAAVIARYSVILATIFVAMMLDRVFSAGLSISAAAIVLLVTFSFALLDGKFSSAVLCCTFFGIASFIKEFIPFLQSSVALLPVYYRPIVTIVPRVAMGLVLYGVYKLALLLTANLAKARLRQIICMVVAVFFGLVTNTVLFLSLLNLFKDVSNVEHDSLLVLIKAGLAINIPVEYCVSMILVPTVVLGVRRGMHLGIDGLSGSKAQAEQSEQTEQTSSPTSDLAEPSDSTSHADQSTEV